MRKIMYFLKWNFTDIAPYNKRMIAYLNPAPKNRPFVSSSSTDGSFCQLASADL